MPNSIDGNTIQSKPPEEMIKAAAPAGGWVIPSLVMEAMEVAVAKGTLTHNGKTLVGMYANKSAIEIARVCPNKAFRGWEAGAIVSPY